jgi:ELWxxDGT repeat protein
MLPSAVLFQGLDSSNHDELWETDGTAAGTFELTGIAATFPTGLYPVNLTPFNTDEVLFNGADKSGLAGLWETDGTAAGTHQLTVAGAYTGSLYPSDFTQYNGEMLFNGYDSSGNIGLWVTDGTSAGTHEVTGIAGVQTTIIGALPGFAPSDFTVYDGEVVFGGYDASGDVGLWVTNGTSAGT